MDSRPTVVLVSGQLLDADTWSAQIAPLSRNYDIRFADHTREASIAGMAERLLTEIHGPFDLLAHAMGGFVAFEVLRQSPERVRSLALLSTLASADGPSQTARREGYIRLVEAGRFPEVVEERVPILLHPSRREDPTLLAAVRRMALATGPETFLNQQRAIMGRIDSRPRLPEIVCPTLLIWGRQDGITSFAHQEEMMVLIPHSRIEIVEDSGHLVTMEQPQRLSEILTTWLAKKT